MHCGPSEMPSISSNPIPPPPPTIPEHMLSTPPMLPSVSSQSPSSHQFLRPGKQRTAGWQILSIFFCCWILAGWWDSSTFQEEGERSGALPDRSMCGCLHCTYLPWRGNRSLLCFLGDLLFSCFLYARENGELNFRLRTGTRAGCHVWWAPGHLIHHFPISDIFILAPLLSNKIFQVIYYRNTGDEVSFSLTHRVWRI